MGTLGAEVFQAIYWAGLRSKDPGFYGDIIYDKYYSPEKWETWIENCINIYKEFWHRRERTDCWRNVEKYLQAAWWLKETKKVSSWKSCMKTQGWHVGHTLHVWLFYRWVNSEHPCISSAVHGARSEGHIPHVPTMRHLITFSPHIINAWSGSSQLDRRWACEWGSLTVCKDRQQECLIPKHCRLPLVKSFSMGLPLNDIRGHMVL